MQSIFPQFGPGNPSGSRAPLVSFPAGKMKIVPNDNGKFLITPEKVKGTISLIKGDDQLIHFQWKDRQIGNIVDDFIIFPNDASLTKVDTKREGDRVYILQYKGSDTRRYFFWMQSKDSSKDSENVKLLNDYMNNVAPTNERTTSSTGPSGQLDQNTLMQMLGAIGNSGGAGGVQMTDLQNILQNMGLPANTNGGGTTTAAATTTSVSAASSSSAPSPSPAAVTSSDSSNPSRSSVRTQSGQPAQGFHSSRSSETQNKVSSEDLRRAFSEIQNTRMGEPNVSLTEVLTPEKILPHISDPDSRTILLPLLPEELQNSGELHATLRSPQLRQSIGSLSHALQTNNINAIMDSFGLDASAGMEYLNRGDGVRAFLAAIQAWGDAQRNSSSSS